jgi:fructokinase
MMRIGIDLGGTKTEIAALDEDGAIRLRQRVPTPRTGYRDVIATIRDRVHQMDEKLGIESSVGIGIPGTISTQTGLVKNANSTQLIGHPIDKDLAAAMGRPVWVANDANCFTLSEAHDGAAAGQGIVFGVIAGTGIGGGICVGGRIVTGAHGIGGEWGHNPLPWPDADEVAGAPACYCGKKGCIETWCSGTGFAADFLRHEGHALTAEEIATSSDPRAAAAIARFIDRFARAIATVVNILDPDTIVLGGGLSNLERLYAELPARVEHYAFKPEGATRIVKNHHGDSSGVRGAAWLWDTDP